MEYPFKDLLPLDEVLEREGYYKDWTHLDPEVFYSLTQISEYIKTKGYGVDVRLLIAQLAEHFGLKTTQVVDLANLLQQKFTNLEGVTQSFTDNINSLVAQMEADKNAVIANVTVDSEVILARGDNTTLGERLDETDTQLAQTVEDLDSRGVNVENFGAVGDFNESTGTGTDNLAAFELAVDYAKENNLSLYVPNKKYLINGTLNIYDSITGEGTLFFPNSNSSSGIRILPKETPISLNASNISGLVEGSSKLTGLGLDLSNHVITIKSNEVLRNRHNPPTNEPYTKNEVVVVNDGEGNISPNINYSYNDTSKITSIVAYPLPKPLEFSVNIRGFGSVDKEGFLVLSTRSNVNFRNFSMKADQNVRTFLAIEGTAFTVLDKVSISGTSFEGFGYGVMIGISAFTSLYDCFIVDCREALTGRNSESVLVLRGSYSNVIDAHEGKNYVIDGVNLRGRVQFAGRDITIINCSIDLSGYYLFYPSSELGGNVIIDNNVIRSDNAYFLSIVRAFEIHYPSPDFFGRIVKGPDLVSITKNELHAPESAVIRLYATAGGSNARYNVAKKVFVSNNNIVNKNNLTIDCPMTDDTFGDMEIIFRDQHLKGSNDNPNVKISDDRANREVPSNRKINVFFDNCEDVSTSIDSSAINKIHINNSSVRRISDVNGVTPFYGEGGTLTNCRVTDAIVKMTHGKFDFVNCVFEGAITLNSLHINMSIGSYAMPGTTGLPHGVDLMNHLTS